MFLFAQAPLDVEPQEAVVTLARLYEQASDFLIEQGPIWGVRIFSAILIFVLGWIAARIFRSFFNAAMQRGRVDATLAGFLSNIAYVFVVGLIIIAALSQLGINTNSLAAVIAAAGLGISLALQNSLSNFASGVMIILFRPFSVGDFIEAGGTSGVVQEIHIFHTVLKSLDNKRIIVPNGEITSNVITNANGHLTRMVDLEMACGYQDDLRAVKQFFQELLQADERILQEPAPDVRVSDLGTDGVKFKVRGWVKTSDWWSVRCDLIEAIKLGFDERGFHIPFPQRDVHLYRENDDAPGAA